MQEHGSNCRSDRIATGRTICIALECGRVRAEIDPRTRVGVRRSLQFTEDSKQLSQNSDERSTRTAFLRLKGTNAAPDNLVFASQKATALRPENVLKRIIHTACVRLGLPKVRWHDLGHTSATLLHQHEPLRVAQAILGHSDLQTTLGYTHVLPGTQREAMKRLEDAVLFPNVPSFA